MCTNSLSEQLDLETRIIKLKVLCIQSIMKQDSGIYVDPLLILRILKVNKYQIYSTVDALKKRMYSTINSYY